MYTLYDFYNKPALLLKYDEYYSPLTLVYDEIEMKKYNAHIYEQVLHIIRKDPSLAYQYAAKVLEHRWLEAEEYILKDPIVAADYAEIFFTGSWPEAEDIIKLDSDASSRYAEYNLKGRFVAGEPAILTSEYRSFFYVKNVIKGRWIEAEPMLSNSSYYGALYALEILDERWPVYEKNMLDYLNADERNISYVMGNILVYMTKVIQGPWKEIEPILLKKGHLISSYARSVLKRRWLEGEHIMKNMDNTATWERYCLHFGISTDITL